MRLYARSGQRYQALRQYDQLRETLQRRFGTKPGAASRNLHEEIVTGCSPFARSTSPRCVSRRPRNSHWHNIPAALSSIVERERQMIKVERALAMTRLLRLTGGAVRQNTARPGGGQGTRKDVPGGRGWPSWRRSRTHNCCR